MLQRKILIALCLIVVSACGPKRYGCGPRRCEVKAKQLHFLNTSNKKHLLVFENQAGVFCV
jgi:hypothetical protein